MKKSIYSIVVIICTVISVVIMICFNNSTAIINGFQLYDVGNEEAIINDYEEYATNKGEENEVAISQEKEFDESDEQIIENNNENLNMEEAESFVDGTLTNVGDKHSIVNEEIKKSDDNKVISNNEVNNHNDSYKYYSSSNSVSRESNKYISEREINDLLNEETAAVFKVNKNTIPSKISATDKLKMLKMANSLSLKDYKSVAENIKRSDELPAATDIFEILRTKLSSENYKELKDILNPYIDIDLIEKNIDKNNG